jgi:hypothetical protein
MRMRCVKLLRVRVATPGRVVVNRGREQLPRGVQRYGRSHERVAGRVNLGSLSTAVRASARLGGCKQRNATSRRSKRRSLQRLHRED